MISSICCCYSNTSKKTKMYKKFSPKTFSEEEIGVLKKVKGNFNPKAGKDLSRCRGRSIQNMIFCLYE